MQEKKKRKQICLIESYNVKYSAHDKNNFGNWLHRYVLKINNFNFLPITDCWNTEFSSILIFLNTWFSFGIGCKQMRLYCQKLAKFTLFYPSGCWNTEFFSIDILNWGNFLELVESKRNYFAKNQQNSLFYG